MFGTKKPFKQNVKAAQADIPRLPDGLPDFDQEWSFSSSAIDDFLNRGLEDECF